ncbi:hypothetical protein EJ05DRAFT_498217 [Pseudovirgaria hyperparasitica]|uniref:Uncharacterized protein n=1 Tax=Pseudovirgaria hyperparasitica TaxID=470096 RepID=A0A6A6WE34_9PEZI|nr:uncharacterized protein EJ05DRAFT_498217 [Pseudovirgaria hyperparasitica]KAF2760250.1 hypothetical protein EJ05DRAFT_498217 [Pseudovirgaria hyperparasitica]
MAPNAMHYLYQAGPSTRDRKRYITFVLHDNDGKEMKSYIDIPIKSLEDLNEKVFWLNRLVKHDFPHALHVDGHLVFKGESLGKRGWVSQLFIPDLNPELPIKCILDKIPTCLELSVRFPHYQKFRLFILTDVQRARERSSGTCSQDVLPSICFRLVKSRSHAHYWRTQLEQLKEKVIDIEGGTAPELDFTRAVLSIVPRTEQAYWSFRLGNADPHDDTGISSFSFNRTLLRNDGVYEKFDETDQVVFVLEQQAMRNGQIMYADYYTGNTNGLTNRDYRPSADIYESQPDAW